MLRICQNLPGLVSQKNFPPLLCLSHDVLCSITKDFGVGCGAMLVSAKGHHGKFYPGF